MLKHSHALFQLASIPMVLIATANAAAIVHDEAIHGDLSGNRLSPTQLVLSAGANSLKATTGAVITEDIEYDQEYLRIDLPANHQLDSIRLQTFDSPDGTAFIGVQNGTTFSFEPDDAILNIGTLLGYAHFGPNEGHNVGDDILADIGGGPGAIGFATPLTDQSYTFWIQQTGALTNYQLDFVVTSIPEPASGLLVLVALVATAFVRGRNRLPLR